jgi:hypothetical protein
VRNWEDRLGLYSLATCFYEGLQDKQVRDVSDEKGSIMEAVGKNNHLHENGVLPALPAPT